ncbi:MAG: PH domain-containing protein [Bacillota bacterium]
MAIAEETIMSTKTSRWIAFGFLGKKYMLIMLLVVIAGFIGSLFEPDLIYVGYAVGGLYLLLFLGRLFGMKKEHVDLSTQRIIIRRRIGSTKKIIIIPLNHVAMFEIEQGKFASKLKFGSIKINTSGSKDVNLESLAKIEAFYETMHTQLTKLWYHEH